MPSNPPNTSEMKPRSSSVSLRLSSLAAKFAVQTANFGRAGDTRGGNSKAQLRPEALEAEVRHGFGGHAGCLLHVGPASGRGVRIVVTRTRS